MRKYPLFAFSNGRDHLIITRGETMEDALSHASDSPSFKRGSTVYHVGYVPINAARMYDSNHSPGWLNRIPEYQRRKELDQLATEVKTFGYDEVIRKMIAEAVSTLKERVE